MLKIVLFFIQLKNQFKSYESNDHHGFAIRRNRYEGVQ